MGKIDLHDIQKKNRNIAIEKPIAKPISKPIEKHIEPISLHECIGNSIKSSIKSPIKKPIEKTMEKPMKKPIENNIEKPIEKSKEFERLKKIKILELYRLEFPHKLEPYKNKKFDKCSDEELDEIKENFNYSITTNSNMQVGLDMAEKALLIYEYIGKNYAGLEIDGISKISQTDEWKDNIKALCLRYMSSPISHVEPEHKILFMLISNSLILHQVNSANKTVAVEEPPKQPKPEVPNTVDPIAQKLKLNIINSKYKDL